MKQEAVLVLDCGATNVRAMAVNKEGKIVAKASVANASQPAQENPAWHNWSLDEILRRLQLCCQHIMPQLEKWKIRAITVTTFGVDGALTDENGQLLYPVISWKCPRTAEVMERIGELIAPEKLQLLSGIGQFSFNTLYKLLWLKEHQPRQLQQAHAWLFISSLINQRLTGVFTTDRTMAGTSQLLDVRAEHFSDTILQHVGLSASLFPRMVEAGEIAGHLLPGMADWLGLTAGTPVISAGHDTQFALFGSGAGLEQPVLSSGTWEILMARSGSVNTSLLPRYKGSTCELDSQRGLFNPGLQWLASGVLEWIRMLYWRGETSPDVYRSMMTEAAAQAPGSEGVRMDTCLLDPDKQAGWRGINLNTTRGHFYRSALESLCWTLQHNLGVLESIGGFKAQELLLVGGGSRNTLWNQMKADVLGLPMKVLDNAETTVLGAAMFAWFGCGEFSSPEQARAQVTYNYRYFYPGEQRDDYHALRPAGG